MTVTRKLIAPTNFQFYISDVSDRQIESFGETVAVVSNGLSVTIPCQSDQEADTELIVGDYAEVPKDGVLVFEGTIPTPGRIVVASNVAMDHLLRFPVAREVTQLTIWTDGQEYPERVVVGVS